MNQFNLKRNKGFSQVVDFGFVFENVSKNLKSLFGKFMLGVGLKFNKSKTFSKPKFTTGFSIVEMLVYIAIMTMILLVIVDIVIVVSRSNKQWTEYNNIKNSAISGLEKITKEIRLATSIDFDQSVFDSSNGVLVLNSKDEVGATKITKFYLSDGLIKNDVNGNLLGPITYDDTKISSLFFVPINTGNSQAVKIELTVDGEDVNFPVSEKFYSTIVLRNSY